jgi:hypothetical protein
MIACRPLHWCSDRLAAYRRGKGRRRPPRRRRNPACWDGVPVQRCTVHKHRNLLAHAPEWLHEELKRRINAQTVLPSADTAAMLCVILVSSRYRNRAALL